MSTLNMFGGVAATVNGNMFGGLFARGAIAKLSAADQAEALKLDGAEMFDPMGNGRVMRDTVFLPETIMDEPGELATWMRKALEYTATLPPKQKRGTAKAKAKAKAKDAPKTKAKAKDAPKTKAPMRSAKAPTRAAARARASKARVKAHPARRR